MFYKCHHFGNTDSLLNMNVVCFTPFDTISRVARKPVFGVSDHVRFVSRAVKQQMISRGLKFRIKEVEGLYYLCSENKGADSCAVTAQLICVFVFTYSKSRFSHNEAPVLLFCTGTSNQTNP